MLPERLTFADSADLARVAELLGQSVPAQCRGLVPYHAAGYARFLTAALAPASAFQTIIVKVIRIHGRIVAVADWRITGSGLFLNGLVVCPQHRGCGLGTALLHDGFGLGRAIGVPAIGLDVAMENASALALYRKTGFTETAFSTWLDVPGSVSGHDCADRGMRFTDWPSFAAHRQAYGFGDLEIRFGGTGTSRVRVFSRAVRIGPEERSIAHTLRGILQVDRSFTVRISATLERNELERNSTIVDFARMHAPLS